MEGLDREVKYQLRKIDSVVEAKQWLDTEESIEEIRSWLEPKRQIHRVGSDAIQVIVGLDVHTVKPGEWIVSDGYRLDVMNPRTFQDAYEPTEPPRPLGDGPYRGNGWYGITTRIQRACRREMASLLADALFHRAGGDGFRDRPNDPCYATFLNPLDWRVDYGPNRDGETMWARIIRPDGEVYRSNYECADAGWLDRELP